ncbi:MAG: putative transrane protein [Gammaproteobacteria bacterium]|jgi:hypothetical protein|nr:putative transrane protein [Gammaproteobacteria bacterium]
MTPRVASNIRPGRSALLAGVLALAACWGAVAGPAPSPSRWNSGPGQFYRRNWGVEVVGVKPVSSGYMLAFRYRVLDPDKAKILNERKSRAYLVDEATGTALMVPTMENVGELRPGATPEAGRTYFMIFGNPGQLVKSGSRVSVVAGGLRIDGLVVQ